MFIPPLPNHMNTENGWAFVCDILLSLPLCIFVRLVNTTYNTKELEEFRIHPLKRNLLVKYLPPSLRQSLLHGRRYVTHVIELINRLCYVGKYHFLYTHECFKWSHSVTFSFDMYCMHQQSGNYSVWFILIKSRFEKYQIILYCSRMSG